MPEPPDVSPLFSIRIVCNCAALSYQRGMMIPLWDEVSFQLLIQGRCRVVPSLPLCSAILAFFAHGRPTGTAVVVRRGVSRASC